MPPSSPPIDILVIGGGIVGQVTAITLAEAGARVTIVDAAQNAGSTANAGSLHVQMQSRFMRLYPEHVARMETSLPLYVAAAREWEQLDARYGPFELVRKGGLMLAESADQMAFLEKKMAREVRRGVSVDLLDRAALDRIAPFLGRQIVGAELCRDEGKLNPLAANKRLRAVGDSLGVAVHSDLIGHVEADANRVTATGRARSYSADRVVVAAAWGSGALTAALGVTIPSRAEPLHMNITEAASSQINHLIQHAERSITLKQFASGQIVIGGGWAAQDRGRHMVPQVRHASMLGNVALAARLVPSIGGIRVIRTWAGMNTTVDGASIIGPLPGHPRVVMAIPGDAGYTLGPTVARLAAASALGADGADEARPFSPDRFAA